MSNTIFLVIATWTDSWLEEKQFRAVAWYGSEKDASGHAQSLNDVKAALDTEFPGYAVANASDFESKIAALEAWRSRAREVLRTQGDAEFTGDCDMIEPMYSTAGVNSGNYRSEA